MMEERLIQIIEDNLTTPFQYGQWDCCIFCMSVVVPDQLDILIGQYSDEAGANAKIQELGGWDAKLTELGGIEVGVNYLQTGDIVKIKDRETLGVFQARKIIVLTDEGFTERSLSFAEKAWRFTNG